MPHTRTSLHPMTKSNTTSIPHTQTSLLIVTTSNTTSIIVFHTNTKTPSSAATPSTGLTTNKRCSRLLSLHLTKAEHASTRRGHRNAIKKAQRLASRYVSAIERGAPRTRLLCSLAQGEIGSTGTHGGAQVPAYCFQSAPLHRLAPCGRKRLNRRGRGRTKPPSPGGTHL